MTTRGILRVKKRKSKPDLVQVEIGGNLFNPSRGEMSADVLPTDGLEVEFDLVGGQPKKIRTVGAEFRTSDSSATRAGATSDGRRSKDGGSVRGQVSAGTATHQHSIRSQQQDRFHNPYNFVPTPQRNTGHSQLGDRAPVDQSRLHPDRYSGRVKVRMTAITPLLVPDSEDALEDRNGHKSLGIRVDQQGLPAITASSVRGMLRSAYEIVTNSRFGKFSDQHKSRLKYRQTKKPYLKVDYPASPWDLLDNTLRPALALNGLSPADRVFGWVNGNGQGAHRGLLRIGPIVCETSQRDSTEHFPEPGVPLAILAQPKPQQGRFYVAKSAKGEAQPGGLSKVEAGYQHGKGLRGRKIYPHQRSLPEGYWHDSMEDRTQQGLGTPPCYQEYRRPRDPQRAEQRDDQNRSIRGWVKPGAEFSFDIHLDNLSSVEVGALLWLLDLPAGHYFRFGGGKPLGFGSVRLAMTDSDLRTGEAVKSRYLSWSTAGTPELSIDVAKSAFQGAVSDAYGGGKFDGVPFIAAYLAACRGFDDDLPVHYPRATDDGRAGPPNPMGESFKWFVANEKEGVRHALPDLVNDRGLPYLTGSPNENQRRRSR